MLFILSMHCIISACCLFSGFLAHTYIFTTARQNVWPCYRPVIIYLITGLIAITAACQCMVLFFPMNNYSKLSILAVLTAGIITTRKKCVALVRHLLLTLKQTHRLALTGMFISWCVIAVLNAGPTMMDDTESYHIQMVKWIQEYGTVTGIANLHERFGFNTSWFSSIAFFSLPAKQLHSFTALNGVLSVWFAAYLLLHAGKMLRKKQPDEPPSISLACVCIFIISLIAWPVVRGNASSCNYDFITTLATFVLCAEMLKASYVGRFVITPEWIIWPAYLFTVRIINYPLLLLSVTALLVTYRQSKSSVLILPGIVFMLIVPFLIRNIALSGYAFFPSMHFNWFAVEWKADKDKTIELLRYIKYFNRVSTAVQNIEVTAALPFPQWTFAWFKNLYTYDKLLIVTGVTGFLIVMAYIRRLPRIPFVFVFVITIAFQLASWFFIAPDPRFVYGCIFCGILLAFFTCNNMFTSLGFIRYTTALLIMIYTGMIVFISLKIKNDARYRNWIAPAGLPRPPVRTVTINNVHLYIPEKILNNWNPRCYGTELPCLYRIDTRLRPRGKTVADGFMLKN